MSSKPYVLARDRKNAPGLGDEMKNPPRIDSPEVEDRSVKFSEPVTREVSRGTLVMFTVKVIAREGTWEP